MIQSVLDAPRTEPFPVPLLVCTLKWHCPLALSGIDEPSWDPRTPAHWGPQTKELGGREAMMVSLVRETKLNVDVKNVLSAPIFSRPVPWRGQAGCFHPLSVSCPLFWGEVGCLYDSFTFAETGHMCTLINRMKSLSSLEPLAMALAELHLLQQPLLATLLKTVFCAA